MHYENKNRIDLQIVNACIKMLLSIQGNIIIHNTWHISSNLEDLTNQEYGRSLCIISRISMRGSVCKHVVLVVSET